jgi:pimeloyl-ACP methyl ester carboxylesterase
MLRSREYAPPCRVAFLFDHGKARRLAACALIALAGLAGCARMPDRGITPLKQPNLAALESYLLTHKPDVDQFRLRGPFEVTSDLDHEIAISPKERVHGDLFLAAPAGKAPLVIFVHGYASTKESHTFQAMHVASWGMHSLSLQLPNAGQWPANGRTLARLVNFINRSPQAIDPRIDPAKIILVGHSFGGTSVMIALAEGAKAAGGVLLDPAGVGRDLPAFLAKVAAPVMILGADERVSVTRNRDYFYRFVRSGVAEVSIRGASHEDAQYPSEFGQASEEMQVSFTSALTAAALSIAATGKFDYAWASFGDAFQSGKLYNAKSK